MNRSQNTFTPRHHDFPCPCMHVTAIVKTPRRRCKGNWTIGPCSPSPYHFQAKLPRRNFVDFPFVITSPTCTSKFEWFTRSLAKFPVRALLSGEIHRIDPTAQTSKTSTAKRKGREPHTRPHVRFTRKNPRDGHVLIRCRSFGGDQSARRVSVPGNRVRLSKEAGRRLMPYLLKVNERMWRCIFNSAD